MSRNHREQRGRVSIQAPQAKCVYVAGDFNGWNPRSHPLRRGRDGQWARVLDLPPGSHAYKFIVDGCWCCGDGRDAAYDGRPGHAPNEFGTMNMVLHVPVSRRERREGRVVARHSSSLRAPLHREFELAFGTSA